MNKVVKGTGGSPEIKPEAKAEIVGTTPADPVEPPKVAVQPSASVVSSPPPRPARNAPAPASPSASVCPKCKGTKRVQFVEKGRKLKSVGPCPDCVKA